jgi:hypothetical protein
MRASPSLLTVMPKQEGSLAHGNRMDLCTGAVAVARISLNSRRGNSHGIPQACAVEKPMLQSQSIF